MAQSTILAAGQSAAQATDVVIASGGSATLSIRSATAGQPIPRNISLPIYLVVGGDEQVKASLSAIEPSICLSAPGTWRVRRPDITPWGVDIQVLSDV